MVVLSYQYSGLSGYCVNLDHTNLRTGWWVNKCKLSPDIADDIVQDKRQTKTIITKLVALHNGEGREMSGKHVSKIDAQPNIASLYKHTMASLYYILMLFNMWDSD